MTFSGQIPDASQGTTGGTGTRGRRPRGADGAGGSSFDLNSFSVLGVDPAATAVGPLSSVTVTSGRALAAADAGQHVVVLDATYATGKGLAVGGTVDVGGTTMTIVGIVASTSSSADTAAEVYLPLDVAQALSGAGAVARPRPSGRSPDRPRSDHGHRRQTSTKEYDMTMTDIVFDPAAETGGPLCRLTAVTKTYRTRSGEVTPLAGVDLEIAGGEFVTIQGPTGGGKSTLLQLLGALDRPTAGSVVLDGTDIASASGARLNRLRAEAVGFVFQGFNLIPTLTAAENVDMGLEPLRLARDARERRVAEALAHVGLADRADHRPGELSGGQQQRVAIARAIAKRPRVLLADEPTGNLDEGMRDEILVLLESLNAEGLTLIVVTHDSAVAHRASRGLRLERGGVRDISG